MIPNVGKLDRVLLIILGLFLIVAPFITGLAALDTSTATIVLIIVGIVLWLHL